MNFWIVFGSISYDYFWQFIYSLIPYFCKVLRIYISNGTDKCRYIEKKTWFFHSIEFLNLNSLILCVGARYWCTEFKGAHDWFAKYQRRTKNSSNFKGHRLDTLKPHDHKLGSHVGTREVKHPLQDFVSDWWPVKFIHWRILFDNDWYWLCVFP